MGEKRRAFGGEKESVFELWYCWVCLDDRRLAVRPSSFAPPAPLASVNAGEVGERVPLGVGERSGFATWMGEPSSIPDIAEGGRYSDMPTTEPLPASTQGESGSAGDLRERLVDLDLWRASTDGSLMLVVLPLRLCVTTLPFRPCAFCGVVLGLLGMFHVTFDGVEGRDEGLVSGWYAGPERGEIGRRRPSIGDSAVSEVGEEDLFPFLWRSSGV